MTDLVAVEMWKTIAMAITAISTVATLLIARDAKKRLEKVEAATDGALTASKATSDAQKVANDRLQDANHQLALIIAATPGKEQPPVVPPLKVVTNGALHEGPAVATEPTAEEITLEAPVSLTVTAPDG